MQRQFNNTMLILLKDDLTELDTDAIVNAANGHLAHGGGVAGAIVRKGGRIIQEESDTWVLARGGSIPTGSAAITSAGTLKARYVIHAVGPRMGEGDEDEKLKSATLSALKMAEDHGLRSLAFPAISTGIFGYPMNRCAGIMLETIREYLQSGSALDKVIVCLYDAAALDVFEAALSRLER